MKDARGIQLQEGQQVLVKWGSENLLATVNKVIDAPILLRAGEQPVDKCVLSFTFNFAVASGQPFANVFALQDLPEEILPSLLTTDIQ